MTQTTTVYSSTDASAPILYGAAGSLVALLKAILVNGYGSKAAAGWTNPYTGTNTAVFQSGNNSNAPSVLFVGDTGTVAATLVGGTAASAANYAGLTNPFPTSAQQTSGLNIMKSATADSSNARPWICVADNRTFYLFIDPTSALTYGYYSCYFGEMYSYKAASGNTDNTRLVVGAGGGSTYSAGTYGSSLNAVGTLQKTSTAYYDGTQPEYMAQSYTGSGGSIQVYKTGDISKCPTNSAMIANSNVPGNSSQYLGNMTYPSPVDGGLYVSPGWVHEYNGSTPPLRGHLRGIWYPLHIMPLSNGDTFSGVGALAGKTFQAINANGGYNGALYQGQLFVETSSTWDSN